MIQAFLKFSYSPEIVKRLRGVSYVAPSANAALLFTAGDGIAVSSHAPSRSRLTVTSSGLGISEKIAILRLLLMEKYLE
jgi:hypothetical protein